MRYLNFGVQNIKEKRKRGEGREEQWRKWKEFFFFGYFRGGGKGGAVLLIELCKGN